MSAVDRAMRAAYAARAAAHMARRGVSHDEAARLSELEADLMMARDVLERENRR